MPYQKYPQNIEYYLYKYKFLDVKTDTIKDGKIFSPYSQFSHTRFEFKNDAEKSRYTSSIDPKKENIIMNLNWNRYEFNFDSYLRDLNLIFVYDEQNGYYRTTNIFEEINGIINKQLGVDSTYNPLKSKTITLSNYDINRIFVDFFLIKKRKFIRYRKSRGFRKNSATKKVFNAINTNSWGINFKKSCKNIYSNSKFMTKRQFD